MNKGLFLVVSIFHFTVADTATSATFEILSVEPLTLTEVGSGRCTILMKGRIEEGDEQRLLDKAQELSDKRLNQEYVWPDNMTTTGLALFPDLVDVQIANRASLTSDNLPRYDALCLNSRGGSFPESLDLVRTIASFGYVTVVPERAECWSACAFVFLSGGVSFIIGGPASESSGGRLGEIMPFRILHADADLRFHAPYFREENLQPRMPVSWMNEKLGEALYNLQAFELYFSDRDTIAPETRFPRELFSAALRQFGPDKWHYVDNVGLAGLYNIRLTGLPEIELSVSSLARACNNVSHWGLSMMSPVSNDLRSGRYDITLDGQPLQCSDPLCTIGDGRYNLSFGSAQCFVRVDRSDEGDDLLVEWSYEGTVREPIWMSFEPWATLPHYYSFDFISGQESFPPFSQTPYLGGSLAEIYPVDGTGEGVMITGYWDSDPFGIFLWPSSDGDPLHADGYFAWMSSDLYIQEELRPVSLDFSSLRFCFVDDAGESDSLCSVAKCTQNVGCNFEPESGASFALEGFPYLSRPIFFGRSSELLKPFAHTPD